MARTTLTFIDQWPETAIVFDAFADADAMPAMKSPEEIAAEQEGWAEELGRHLAGLYFQDLEQLYERAAAQTEQGIASMHDPMTGHLLNSPRLRAVAVLTDHVYGVIRKPPYTNLDDATQHRLSTEWQRKADRMVYRLRQRIVPRYWPYDTRQFPPPNDGLSIFRESTPNFYA